MQSVVICPNVIEDASTLYSTRRGSGPALYRHVHLGFVHLFGIVLKLTPFSWFLKAFTSTPVSSWNLSNSSCSTSLIHSWLAIGVMEPERVVMWNSSHLFLLHRLQSSYQDPVQSLLPCYRRRSVPKGETDSAIMQPFFHFILLSFLLFPLRFCYSSVPFSVYRFFEIATGFF